MVNGVMVAGVNSGRARRQTSFWSRTLTLLALAGGLIAATPAARAQDQASAAAAAPAAAPRIGMLEIEGKIKSKPSPLAWLSGAEGQTLRVLVQAIQAAGQRENIPGLVIRLKDAELSRTDIEELGAALKEYRAGGKRVTVFAENYGPAELLLAAYADDAVIQSGGAVMLPGMHMEEMYLADTLQWLGLKADMVQVGAYKGANEPMTRTGPSPEWDLNINQLLDGLYGNMRSTLKQGRQLSDEQLEEAMKVAWMAEAADAQRVKLIDAQVDLPKLAEHAAERVGARGAKFVMLKPEGKSPLENESPLAIFAMLSREPKTAPDGPALAIVHVDGAIVDGDSSAGGFSGEGTVGSRTIRNALEEIYGEDNIRGVIVRIESPGGSAIASEVIWQGLQRVAQKKPVWVSVGSMAASGGYYIASAGSKIYVNPSSIVGSIGVVGGKISMQGLYDWAKVHVVGRSRGPRAEMFASNRAWGASEEALVREKMTQTFNLFKQRVALGRPGIDLDKTAGGWIFTGTKAIDLNMADKVGGLELALRDLAEAVKLDDYEVVEYPGPKSLEEMMEEVFGRFVAAPRVSAPDLAGGPMGGLLGQVRQLMGGAEFDQAATYLDGLLQLKREPVILMGPSALIFR